MISQSQLSKMLYVRRLQLKDVQLRSEHLQVEVSQTVGVFTQNRKHVLCDPQKLVYGPSRIHRAATVR
jgi:hypothetical protein